MAIKQQGSVSVEAFLRAKRQKDPNYGVCAPGMADATPLSKLREIAERNAMNGGEYKVTAAVDVSEQLAERQMEESGAIRASGGHCVGFDADGHAV